MPIKFICVEVPETEVILLQVDNEKRNHVLSLGEAESLANTLLKMVAHLTQRPPDLGQADEISSNDLGVAPSG